MKKYIIGLVIAVALFTGCKKSAIGYILRGRVVSEVTGEGIPASVISVTISSNQGEGYFSYQKNLYSGRLITDANGYFSANIIMPDEPDTRIKFYKEYDAYSATFTSQKTAFMFDSVKNKPLLVFYTRRLEPLKINVNNIHPVNDSDAFGVYIYADGSSAGSQLIESIQNFGIKNRPLDNPAYDDGLNPDWLGQNVHSTINAKLQEQTYYYIHWFVRKNGVINNYSSPKIYTVSNAVNSFDINY